MGENVGILITALSALVVALFGAVNTLIGKKARGPADEQAARRDTIADRDGLISKLNERIDDLEVRVKSTEDEIKVVKDHNNILINYCYRLIAVIRRHGHEDEIPTPPPNGIHI